MGIGNRSATHSFAQIPSVNTGRSVFDRSFAVKDTFDFDYLIPIMWDEVLPGDSITLRLQSFIRLATQKVPIMDNMYIDYFAFFVPNRLTWENWQRFCGEQDDPDDQTDYLTPVVTWGSASVLSSTPNPGTLYDKFGLPTQIGLEIGSYLSVLAFPWRAYNLIWNEWFRDQNLQDRVSVPKDDGPDDPALYTLLKRGKRHDYFTSCLPWPQKGGEVLTPFQLSPAPVILTPTSANLARFVAYDGSPAGNGGISSQGSNDELFVDAMVGGKLDPNGTLQVSFADVYGPSVNQLREAFMVQSLLELDARGGTRYVELLKAHFNVTSPDFRLQRPEYLGGGRAYINCHPVPQNSGTTEDGTPQGTLASFGTSATNGEVGFTKAFTEHGVVIMLACARADITYQQGVDRLWSRRTRYDYFWPKLQEMGEQPVLQREIYFDGNNNTEVFGYQERYGEYRFKRSEIKGLFRSKVEAPFTSLDMWHMAQEFESTPVLSDEFIEQNTPIERAIAVTDEPHLLADFFFKYKHVRPMMTYGVPATIGRF